MMCHDASWYGVREWWNWVRDVWWSFTRIFTISFAEYCLFYRALLTKTPISLSMLLIDSLMNDVPWRHVCISVFSHPTYSASSACCAVCNCKCRVSVIHIYDVMSVFSHPTYRASSTQCAACGCKCRMSVIPIYDVMSVFSHPTHLLCLELAKVCVGKQNSLCFDVQWCHVYILTPHAPAASRGFQSMGWLRLVGSIKS